MNFSDKIVNSFVLKAKAVGVIEIYENSFINFRLALTTHCSYTSNQQSHSKITASFFVLVWNCKLLVLHLNCLHFLYVQVPPDNHAISRPVYAQQTWYLQFLLSNILNEMIFYNQVVIHFSSQKFRPFETPLKSQYWWAFEMQQILHGQIHSGWWS